MRNQSRYGSFAVCVAVLLAVSPGRTEKLPSKHKRSCMTSYEGAQEARREHKLASAKEQLLVCAQSTCGKVMRKDCVKWLDEVVLEMQVLASLQPGVLESRSESKTVTAATAAPAAVPAASPAAAVQQPVKPVKSDAATTSGASEPKPESAPAAAVALSVDERAAAEHKDKGKSYLLPAVLGSVGVVGVGGFIALATAGKHEQAKLPVCWPQCSESIVRRAEAYYVAADVSLGVGLAALGTATWLLLKPSSPSEGPSSSPRGVAFAVDPSPGHVSAQIQGVF
jgi:hypothetical protein